MQGRLHREPPFSVCKRMPRFPISSALARGAALLSAAVLGAAVLGACSPTPAPAPPPTLSATATGGPVIPPQNSPLPSAVPAAVGTASLGTAAAAPAAYPTPARPIPPTAAPTLTPDPTKGSVRGALLVRMNGADVAIRNATLYLAPLVLDPSGKEIAAGLDRITSPRTTSNDQGEFQFQNVPPGRYALVLDLIQSAYMLRMPADGQDLLATVSAGKQSDLGRLTYAQLPLTPMP